MSEVGWVEKVEWPMGLAGGWTAAVGMAPLILWNSPVMVGAGSCMLVVGLTLGVVRAICKIWRGC